MWNHHHLPHLLLWGLRVALALACMGILIATGDPLAIGLGSILSGLLLFQLLFRDDRPPDRR